MVQVLIVNERNVSRLRVVSSQERGMQSGIARVITGLNSKFCWLGVTRRVSCLGYISYEKHLEPLAGLRNYSHPLRITSCFFASPKKDRVMSAWLLSPLDSILKFAARKYFDIIPRDIVDMRQPASSRPWEVTQSEYILSITC